MPITGDMKSQSTGRFGTFEYSPKQDRYVWDEMAVKVLGDAVDPETTYPDILARIPKAVRKPYEEWRMRVVESGRPASARIPFDLPDGRITLEVHLHRRRDVVHGLVVDVTKQEQADRERSTQLTIMNFAERIASFGTWAYDIHADVFAASQGAVDLLLPGADPAEFTFDKVLELIDEGDRPKVRAAYDRALSTGQVQHIEFRLQEDDRWFALQFMRILDHDGEPTHTCGMIHETSDLHAESHWREEYEHLQELHEVRARFVNAAAHELNQPLTPMRLELAMLSHKMPSDEKVQRSFTVIKRNVDRLEFMMRDLLDASRSQAGQLQVDVHPVDVRRCIDHVIDTLRPLGRQRRVGFAWTPEDLPLVMGDAMRMEQCLSNLMHNALKFTKESSNVEVHATSENGAVAISVRDEGPGLDESQQTRLFGAFEQIHASPAGFRGTGLGLFVTKSLMEAMQGQIRVESTPGTGSTFTLEFPKANQVAQEATQTRQT